MDESLRDPVDVRDLKLLLLRHYDQLSLGWLMHQERRFPVDEKTVRHLHLMMQWCAEGVVRASYGAANEGIMVLVGKRYIAEHIDDFPSDSMVASVALALECDPDLQSYRSGNGKPVNGGATHFSRTGYVGPGYSHGGKVP